jgi:Clostripain family
MPDKPKPKSKKTKQSNGENEWTVMLYIAADSNLANFAVESLKQLNESAGKGVVVAAQFAVDAPGGQRIPRYIFDAQSQGSSIQERIVDHLVAPKNMTEQEALASFLAWVYDDKKNPRCRAKNYALILWGHGPELVFQPPSVQIPSDPCGDPGEDHQGPYLSPIELRNALREGIPQVGGGPDPKKKPRIIGMDACSMSMIEVAYEIRDYADYMVASQEEVPDLSFPYNSLVKYFQKPGDDVEDLCTKSVHQYVLAYQDYICDANTGMKKVTLAAVRLGKLGTLEGCLAALAKALIGVRNSPAFPALLLAAREESKGFAGGLYADIFSFCEKLSDVIDACSQIPSDEAKAIVKACKGVCDALGDESEEGCILANQATDRADSHGLSIYFPYMDDEEADQISEPLVKGGTDTIGKGFTAVMNRAASSVLLCIRRQLIIDTEEYYRELKLSEDTKWDEFIQTVWSRFLAGCVPHQLDLRYSAQQAAVNLGKTVELMDPPDKAK